MKYTVLFFAFFMSIGLSAQTDTNKMDSNGKRHGVWKGTYDESKRPKYEGTFDHGKETGVFKFFDDTKAGKIVATRDFTAKDGSCYTTFFDAKGNKVSEGKEVNKQREGEWKSYHKESKVVMTKEIYSKGKLNGLKQVYYPNGKIAEETGYANDVMHGVYKKYAENGVVLEEATYKQAKFDGPAVYREAAKGYVVVKGQFKDGLKVGKWQYYDNNKLTKEVDKDDPNTPRRP